MQFILLDSSPPASASTTTWAILAVGVLAAVYIAFVRPTRTRKKDPLEKPAPEPGLARQRAVERDMSNLLVEFAEMARQMTGQLDTRAAKLEALLREADEKIAELRALSEGRPVAGGGGRALVEANVREAAAVALSEAVAVGRLAFDTGPGAIDPRHAEVYDLADEGRSAQDIARQTGRPSGEVELILALRGR